MLLSANMERCWRGMILQSFGGASAYGGTGTVPGVIVGAVLMGIINQGMSIMGTDQNMQKVVKGAVLLAAVIFDVVSKRKSFIAK